MIRKLYLVARTALTHPRVEAALAIALVGAGIAKLTELGKNSENLLLALNRQIGDRRQELGRVTMALRAAETARAHATPYPAAGDVDPLQRAEPEPAEPTEP
jgi:hypothetical protein